MNGFVECPTCQVWADIPEGFKEIRHFAKCPKCGKAMFLARGISPKEIGLKETQKVIAGLILHKKKL